jgi:hypothetical protein
MNFFTGVFTIAGIAIGGLWVVYRFVLHRTSKPRLLLGLDVRSIEPAEEASLVLLHLTALNESAIGIRRKAAFLNVSTLPMAGSRAEIARIHHFQLKPDRVFLAFEHHNYLEPGERFDEDVLLRVPKADHIECRVVFLGMRPDFTWTTQRIIRVVPDNKAERLTRP